MNLTIIIPTHEDRTRYLHRCLTWYGKQGFSGNIIIADSSSDKVFQKNTILCNSPLADKLKIKHLSFPKSIYTDGGKIMCDLPSEIHTDYICCCGDDDLQVPATLNQCVDFLDENPKYIGSHGCKLKVWLTPKEQNVSCNMTVYPGQFLDIEDPIIRFRGYMYSCTSPQYHVIRKPIFIKMYENSFKLPNNYFLVSEVLPSSLYYIFGKVKRFDDIQLYMEMIEDTYSQKNPHYIVEGINSHEWGICVSGIRQIIGSALIEQGANRVDAFEAFDMAFNLRIMAHFHDQLANLYSSKMDTFTKWYKAFQEEHPTSGDYDTYLEMCRPTINFMAQWVKKS